MARYFSKDVSFYVAGFDPSKSTTRLEVSLISDALDPTGFGEAGERVIAGEKHSRINWSGLFNDAATTGTADLDSYALSNIGSLAGTARNTFSVIYGLVGTGTSGKVAFAGTLMMISSRPPAKIGDLVRYEAEFAVDGTLYKGFSHFEKITYTGTGTGIVQIGGTTDFGTNGLSGFVWIVHTFDAIGMTAGNIDLYHSNDGTGWSAKSGGNGVTTYGSGTVLWQSPAGTMFRYSRIVQNGFTGTSITLASVLVR